MSSIIKDTLFANRKIFSDFSYQVRRFKSPDKPKEVTNKYNSIPWSEIAKMRDVLTHHYFGVDDKVLWDTLDEDFRLFKQVIVQIIEENKN